MVFTDASSLVKYITRFTEECFAALIATIFIFKAFEKILHINDHNSVLIHPDENGALLYQCGCALESRENATGHHGSHLTPFATIGENFTKSQCTSFVNNDTDEVGVLTGDGCEYTPDVFFFSCILFAGTFFIAKNLKVFRQQPFFPGFVSEGRRRRAFFEGLTLFPGSLDH